MNKQKHKVNTPSTNLQKSSVIFMQLGLILSLFVVYLTLEHKSFYKVKPIAEVVIEDNDSPIIPPKIIYEKPKPIVNKKIEKVVQKVVQVQKPSSDFEVVKDTKKEIEEAVLTTTDDDQDDVVKITSNDIQEVDNGETTDEIIPFFIIEIAPAFPSCKGSESEKKICFNEKMRKHINRKFNTDIARDLGLSPGKKRINVQFIIDKTGNITNIKVKAPHKRLEKEAKRIINLLPQMIPATQRLKHVKVRYNLPIIFNVEDY